MIQERLYYMYRANKQRGKNAYSSPNTADHVQTTLRRRA